jgi:hypothetical protein
MLWDALLGMIVAGPYVDIDAAQIACADWNEHENTLDRGAKKSTCDTE